jgi:putative DNA primase/helicase
MIEQTIDPFTPRPRPLPTQPSGTFAKAASASADLRPEPTERETPALKLAVEPDGVVLTCGSSLKPEPVSWLWRDWLAQGKLHILAGAPGQGKTTIALAFMATVTGAGRWPDGTRCPVGNVLMWTGEDDPADTLIPRLMAMGADIGRVFFVTGNRLGGEVQPFDPAKDMPQILAQAERIGNVRMLVLDPVVSVVLGDSHKNTEVRRAMQPLVELGAALGAVVLGITHFSKGGAGSDPASRVIGSIAFTAVARVVLVAAKSPTDDNENRRVLARSKSNIGPDEGGFEYHIDQAEPLPGIQASYIAWGGSVAGSARELLAEPDHDQGDSGEVGAFDDACAFLRSELANGPKSAKYLLGEARQAGHSERTIKRAKAHLKVESRKESTGWLWGLVEDAEDASGPRMPRMPRIPTSENLGTVGTLEPETEVF